MPTKVFISYRRDDDPSAAARVRDALADRIGSRNVFMDVDDLKAGQRFEDELSKALADCHALVAIIGPQWLAQLNAKLRTGERDYVRQELATAIERRVPVIPVRVGRTDKLTPLPSLEQLPEDIRDLAMHQAHDVTHEHFAGDIATLAKDLQGFAPRRWRLKISRRSAAVLSVLGLFVVYYVVRANWPIQPTMVLQTERLFNLAKQNCEEADAFFKRQASLIQQVGCDGVTSCPTLQVWREACLLDQWGQAADYRNRIKYAFAFEPKCKGIRVLEYQGQESALKDEAHLEVLGKKYWALLVDYAPGDRKTSWTLVLHTELDKSTFGDVMEPKDMAFAICTIINNQIK